MYDLMHCCWRRYRGMPPKMFKLSPSEVASGVFWSSRKIVAQILLHVEVNVVGLYEIPS